MNTLLLYGVGTLSIIAITLFAYRSDWSLARGWRKLKTVKRKVTGGWRLQSGKGSEAMEERFLEKMDGIDLPEQEIPVQVPIGDDKKKEVTYTPEEYKQMVSRQVVNTVKDAYQTGRHEGLLRAENDDRHFKMTLLSMGATMLNALMLLVILKEMGVLNF